MEFTKAELDVISMALLAYKENFPQTGNLQLADSLRMRFFAETASDIEQIQVQALAEAETEAK